MSSAPTAQQVLDREFLDIRAKLLDLAACFDRLDRASGTLDQDPRMAPLRQALERLREARPDRAEQVQLAFSREYQEDWREKLDL